MILVGIDIGKLSHHFCVYDSDTGTIVVGPKNFKNSAEGFKIFEDAIGSYPKDRLRIGMEDTGHYHLTLLKYLLDQHYSVALINPVKTDLARKLDGSPTKTDRLDTVTICNVMLSASVRKPYRITNVNSFAMYEMKQLTRHHHNLKEELNMYKNRLQKSIDITFPEFNSLFSSKYGVVYMNILKSFGSAGNIASASLKSLRKSFEIKGRGNRISLTAEKLKEAAELSVGMPSSSETIQIRHLVGQIELVETQIEEIDKKIEEFSTSNNSPILTIPGISHFSGTSILAELGDINNYSSPEKIVKFAGVCPYTYESSQYEAKNLPITKKGSRYLRKTLYQIIIPVITCNPVYKKYYDKKRSHGKSHRCACGHCVRKLIRVIYHLLTTNQAFDPNLLV